MNPVKFTCTSLPQGKKGILRADADGYFTQPIGGLNCYNSAGHYYPYEEARALFQQSASFMRRVSSGCLKGELGHPKPAPGESMASESFMRRVLTIDERNVCVHFKSIWLDMNSIKDSKGRPVVAIMAAYRPTGPQASALERSVTNPNEDTCFSIRSFTEDVRRGGVVHRNMREVVTFDHVTEPGIEFARKYRAPGLENLAVANESFSFDVTPKSIEEAIAPSAGFGMEGATQIADSLFRALGWDMERLNTPSYMKW